MAPGGQRRCYIEYVARSFPQRDPTMYDQDQDLDLFEMANLYPDTTGLPMTVWVSPRGHAQHDARVKVNMAHGPSMDVSNTAVVGIRPVPSLIRGSLSTADKQ